MSWQDRRREWTPPTLRELVEVSMPANVEQAARDEARARRAVELMEMTDKRIGEARADVRRYISEQSHWRRELEYWRGLLRRFPAYAERPATDVLKAMTGDAGVEPAKVLRPHWNEPRERVVGEDDADDSIPF